MDASEAMNTIPRDVQVDRASELWEVGSLEN